MNDEENLIEVKDLKKGVTYYLTGLHYNAGSSTSLINEPVKFKYFLDKNENKIKELGRKHGFAYCQLVNDNSKIYISYADVLFIDPIQLES